MKLLDQILETISKDISILENSPSFQNNKKLMKKESSQIMLRIKSAEKLLAVDLNQTETKTKLEKLEQKLLSFI